jgi:hypothetical protein
MMLPETTAVLAAMLVIAAASALSTDGDLVSGQENYDVCVNAFTIHDNPAPDKGTFNGGPITGYKPLRTYTLCVNDQTNCTVHSNVTLDFLGLNLYLNFSSFPVGYKYRDANVSLALKGDGYNPVFSGSRPDLTPSYSCSVNATSDTATCIVPFQELVNVTSDCNPSSVLQAMCPFGAKEALDFYIGFSGLLNTSTGTSTFRHKSPCAAWENGKCTTQCNSCTYAEMSYRCTRSTDSCLQPSPLANTPVNPARKPAIAIGKSSDGTLHTKEAYAKAKSETKAKPEGESKPELNPKPEKSTQNDDGVKPKPKLKPEQGWKSEKEKDPEKDTIPEKDTYQEKYKSPGKETESEKEAKPEKNTKIEQETRLTKSGGTGKDAKPENETEPKKEIKPDKDAKLDKFTKHGKTTRPDSTTRHDTETRHGTGVKHETKTKERTRTSHLPSTRTRTTKPPITEITSTESSVSSTESSTRTTESSTSTTAMTTTITETSSTTTSSTTTSSSAAVCTSGTAFGYWPGDSITLDTQSGNGCNRWGWYETPTLAELQSGITGTLYVGAGMNDISKATDVGDWTAIANPVGGVTVTYSFSPPYTATEINIDLDCLPIATCTPGQYTYGNTFPAPGVPVASNPVPLQYPTCSGGSVAYLIIHAQVTTPPGPCIPDVI